MLIIRCVQRELSTAMHHMFDMTVVVRENIDQRHQLQLDIHLNFDEYHCYI